jgi:hypothetical protein
MCGGRGELVVESLHGLLLYEWIEGVLDLDTEDSWLKAQMERIIKARKQARDQQRGGADDRDYED